MQQFLCEAESVQLIPRISIRFRVPLPDGDLRQELSLQDDDSVEVYLMSRSEFEEHWRYYYRADFSGEPEKMGFYSRNVDYPIQSVAVGCDDATLSRIVDMWPSFASGAIRLMLETALGPEENAGGVSVQRRFALAPRITLVAAE